MTEVVPVYSRVRKIIIVLLVSVMALSSVGCSSDTGVFEILSDQWRNLSQGQPNPRDLSAHQLVQKIADTIRNRSDVGSTYESIPEKQRDQLSLDSFQQYIALLSKGISGAIVSFSQMTQEDLEAIQETINTRLPEQRPLVETLSGFWIQYRGVGQSDGSFAIFVSEPEDQPATLAGDWIEQIIALQHFSTLYFDALDRGDVNALTALLIEQDLPQPIIQIRAERLIDFYQNNINSQTDDFKLTHARIDSIGFEEFGIIYPDQTQSVSRTIEIIQIADGRYSVQDILPERIQPIDLQIRYDEKLLLTFGSGVDGENAQVLSGELESIIGEPLVHDDTVCTTAPNGVQRLNLEYGSLRLKAEGSCFRHSRWSGTVTEIELFDADCSIGSGLHPGDSVERLLLQYPFAREANFIIRGETSLGRVQLQFNIEDEQIQSIILSH